MVTYVRIIHTIKNVDEMGWGQRVSVKWGRVVACGDTIENEVLIWVWALECVEDV